MKSLQYSWKRAMKMNQNLIDLNSKYENLTYLDRLKALFEEFDPEKILVTTSMGGSSIVLLHLINKVAPRHPIHLIDTGYLFKETHAYKEHLMDQFDLNIVDVQPRKSSHEFTTKYQVWNNDTDFCCFINKVEPMAELKKGKDVWISGLLRFQNANRADKQIFEQSKGLLKFHPIIDMGPEDLNLYRTIYELPTHPLQYEGYGSIGCVHCTKKGKGREGRWQGQEKTECGLHV